MVRIHIVPNAAIIIQTGQNVLMVFAYILRQAVNVTFVTRFHAFWTEAAITFSFLPDRTFPGRRPCLDRKVVSGQGPESLLCSRNGSREEVVARDSYSIAIFDFRDEIVIGQRIGIVPTRAWQRRRQTLHRRQKEWTTT